MATPEEDPSLAPPAPEGGGPPVTPLTWTAGAALPNPQGIQWDVAWKGAFLAGLLAAVLCAAPGVSLGCCLWLLGAGALAVWLYQRRVPGVLVTPGMGVRIGAVSGTIGFVATTVWMVFHFATNSQELRTAMAQQMDKSIAANPDPRAQELMRQFTANLNTPEGLATFFVVMLAVMAIVFVIFTAAGGALGASMFARRRNLR